MTSFRRARKGAVNQRSRVPATIGSMPLAVTVLILSSHTEAAAAG